MNEYRKRYPEKAKAQNKVAHAVRTGQLVKPETCTQCGKEGRIHGHHANYNRPLDVIWLCPACHKYEHCGPCRKKLKTPTHPWDASYQPAPMRDKHLELAKALHTAGKSYTEIAKATGVSRGTAYKWLNPKPEYK